MTGSQSAEQKDDMSMMAGSEDESSSLYGSTSYEVHEVELEYIGTTSKEGVSN